MFTVENKQKRTEIIHKFFETISWGDECNVHFVNNLIPVVTHDDTWFLPCWYENEQQFKREIATILALVETAKELENLEKKPCLIIDGDFKPQAIDGLLWQLQTMSVTPFFVTIKSQINYDHWMMRALDGLDWGRTFQAFCEKGRDAKPVMQWD